MDRSILAVLVSAIVAHVTDTFKVAYAKHGKRTWYVSVRQVLGLPAFTAALAKFKVVPTDADMSEIAKQVRAAGGWRDGTCIADSAYAGQRKIDGLAKSGRADDGLLIVAPPERVPVCYTKSSAGTAPVDATSGANGVLSAALAALDQPTPAPAPTTPTTQQA